MLRAGGQEVQWAGCHFQPCTVVCLLFTFSLSVLIWPFAACLNSAGAELCWHQRNLSLRVDICSAQPHVTGRCEAVCGGVCWRCFNEPRAAAGIVAETEAGGWGAPQDGPALIFAQASVFLAGILVDGCEHISLIRKCAAAACVLIPGLQPSETAEGRSAAVSGLSGDRDEWKRDSRHQRHQPSSAGTPGHPDRLEL